MWLTTQVNAGTPWQQLMQLGRVINLKTAVQIGVTLSSGR